MDLLKDIQTALIIDDNETEVKNLILMLHERSIYTTYVNPGELDERPEMTFKNHQLIFMDYSLDDRVTNGSAIISLMRTYLSQVCGKEFGPYGLIIWTRHWDEVNEIKAKLSIDAEKGKYTTPLFVIGLEKTNYLGDNYSSLMDDLNQELQKNKAAAFFFNWRQSVEKGADKALKEIYTLVPDYTKQEEEFPYLLYRLAYLYSGAPDKSDEMYSGATTDAYKAFNELLHHDVTVSQSNVVSVLEGMNADHLRVQDIAEELKLLSRLNSKFLIDDTIPNPALVLPGRVYKVKQEIPQLHVPEAPKKSTPIAIELTPPCDAQNAKKVSSRLVGGFMIDCPLEEEKIAKKLKAFKRECRTFVWPIYYDNAIKFVCFDYRCLYTLPEEELADPEKFEVLFAAKNRLFAELLQKFSSHAARFGLAIIQPEIDMSLAEEKK